MAERTGKAVLYDPVQRNFIMRSYAFPVPQPGEVLVRLTCCTICGSDLHTYTGKRCETTDLCVLGHEMVGVIETLGDLEMRDYHGNLLKKGDRVTWSMVVSCGACFYCTHGLSQKCASKFKYGHDDWDGVPTGGLAEHCLLKEGTPIFKVPDSLVDIVVAPANCAVATVAAAARLVQETHPIAGSRILITGSGMLGLVATCFLTELNGEVVVAEPNAKRRKQAKSFGATLCVDPNDPGELARSFQSFTEGEGFDICLDFSGHNSGVEQCLDSVRVGGCVMLVGSVFPTDSIELNPEVLVRKMLTIRGLHNYRPDDLATAIDFLTRTSSIYPFAELIGRLFRLDESEQAFDFALQESPIRVGIVMLPKWMNDQGFGNIVNP